MNAFRPGTTLPACAVAFLLACGPSNGGPQLPSEAPDAGAIDASDASDAGHAPALKYCYEACAADADCLSGYVCRDAQCQVPCTVDADCGATTAEYRYFCSEGLCHAEWITGPPIRCGRDYACEPGWQCDDTKGWCVCDDDADCSGGRGDRCVAGACTCLSDASCRKTTTSPGTVPVCAELRD